ncbi:long-chain-acyl-CoA synthetase [Bauldia litoralis]|uniref:Fatty-acyl-CoA synthase n=1 Tax=Bauldia litoralis TaxID=665467 RepID=A0A1G6BXW5_9HYPH|nr:long-chain-acyl-CoA synthetase [Bauldia litoralis]SDB25472.1 fatty-acyl-CoA synthase [Bauldia litoralis]
MSFLDNLRKDWVFAHGVFKALRRVTPMARHRNRTFADAMEDLAERFGDRPALISARETLSYADYNGRGNRYARWAMANGIEKGDVVCLLMPNRPEYAAVWLGIARAGGTTALLNTNLAGAALAHCINLVSPKHIIVAAELADSFDTAAPMVKAGPTVWGHGAGVPGWPRIDDAIMDHGDEAIPAGDRPTLTLDDRCLFIYTSGTTGLPKAANINHYRVHAAMLAYASVMEMTAQDRNYNCLPMYHTSGGILAIGCGLMVGGSSFIAERFSARQFWDDVVDNDCTRFQYIGELCRYLVTAPPHPKERMHKVRLVCGNGLRPDVWERFTHRFGITAIREFYAATEGNAIIFNWDSTPGAVGRIPRWARTLFPVTNIRFDFDHDRPVRDDDGLCIECDDDETGEMISRIVVNPLKPGQRFDGYADRSETEKKILRDVFVAGDMWFRTGDLMRRDRRGYFYFVDRIGDTFRWKGENISTAEVAEALSLCVGVDEANVYGVEVAHAEGRAGMAALAVNDDFSLEAFRDHLHATLSSHARPPFVRFRQSIDATSTFKQRKIDLVREGFDPSQTHDPIYFDDPAAAQLVRIDAALHRRIHSGDIRF